MHIHISLPTTFVIFIKDNQQMNYLPYILLEKKLFLSQIGLSMNNADCILTQYGSM